MTQRYTIIYANEVVNVIDYDTEPSNPPPGFGEGFIAVQSDTAQIGWGYIDSQFIPPTPPAPTPEELITECKTIATSILNTTDWTAIPDVADPLKSNPYLINQNEFVAYRSTIRNYAVNPVEFPDWPTLPTEQWSS